MIAFLGLPAFQQAVGVLAMLFVIVVAQMKRTRPAPRMTDTSLDRRGALLTSFLGLAVISHMTGGGASPILPLTAGGVASLLFVWVSFRSPRD